MFCEKCGTRVDDGQPFCPNCGNRLSVPETAPASAAAPAAPADPGLGQIPGTGFVAPAPAPRKALKLPSLGGLTDKFNSLKGMKQIYYGCSFCLLILCFILSLLKVYYVKGGAAFGLATGASWLLVLSNILFTLSVTFFLLDAFGKFSFKWLRFFIAGSAVLILFLFVIVWIAGVDVFGYTTSVRLSVGGWFFLIFQAGLSAVTILYILEKNKS